MTRHEFEFVKLAETVEPVRTSVSGLAVGVAKLTCAGSITIYRPSSITWDMAGDRENHWRALFADCVELAVRQYLLYRADQELGC